MKTIDKLSFVPLLALLLFAGSCEKDGGVFMRENDAIACDCTEQSISQNVLCDGEWVADCGDVEWIAITPERGSGNGKDYGFFTLNIQYNSEAERTATVHLVYDGAAYPITVTQGACEFAYGEPRVEGNLFRNIESTATLRLPYVCASGRESVEISCTITGAAADGLSVTKQVYTGFAKGSGELTIPVEGAATRAGAVAFELFADGVSVGSCRANVISDPDAVPEGLPVGWNFHYRQMRKNFPFRKQSFFFIKYSVQQVVRINNSFHQNICSSLTDNAYRFACCLVRIFYMDDFYVFGILFECRIFFQNSRISDHQKLRNSFFQCAGNSIFRVRIIGTDYGNPFSMI